MNMILYALLTVMLIGLDIGFLIGFYIGHSFAKSKTEDDTLEVYKVEDGGVGSCDGWND